MSPETEDESGDSRFVWAVWWFTGHVFLFLVLLVTTGAGAGLFLVTAAIVTEVGIWKRKVVAAWGTRVRQNKVMPAVLSHANERPTSLTEVRETMTYDTNCAVSHGDRHGHDLAEDCNDELVEVRPVREATPYPSQAISLPGSGREGKPLKSNAPRDKVAFFGPGRCLDLGIGTLDGPLVYATACPNGGRFDASLIDATLRVIPAAAISQKELPYWPTYYESSPAQRAQYLNWLLTGRRDPKIELGYVFIYFYGLERRVLIDRADFLPVATELLELMRIYSYSNSFRRYASTLLWRTLLLASKLNKLPGNLFDEAVDATERWNDDQLSMALAMTVDETRPLPTALAMAICQHDPRSTSSVVVRRHKAEFARLFRSRYEADLSYGQPVRVSKRPQRLHYHPASPTLLHSSSKEAVQNFEAPSVLGLKSQFNWLVNIWEQCVDDLKAYSRVARRNDGEVTAEVYESLPVELRDGDHPEFEAWMRVWEANVDEEGWPIVPASTLAGLKGFEPRGTLTKSQCARVLATADAIGIGVEPDARITGKNYQWDERLTLFFLEDETPCDVPNYLAASVLLRLGATVAQADGRIDVKELEFITEHLEQQFDLSDSDVKRLERLRYLLLHSQSGDSTVTKTLSERLTQRQRRLVGEFLVGVAAADDVVTPKEVKTLRKAYRALGLADSYLDDLLAECATATVTTPSRVASEPTQELRLDMAAISRIMTETKQVAAVLREAMTESEPKEAYDSDGETNPAEVKSDRNAAATPQFATAADGATEGLDDRYASFLHELLQRERWPAPELRALADRCGVMVSGAVEAINEWSLDTHGDWLVDEGDPYCVKTDLLRGDK
jgi:uncharacterized tellurite resistance protein B-like protein